MRSKAACLLITFIVAGGCDGDGDLDGTWSYPTTENGATVYRGELIIVQERNSVTLRDCQGNRTDLTREGNSLLNADGSTYYLHVVDNETLAGPGDRGGTSTVVKLSSSTRFAHGILHIVSEATGDLRAVDDVCAERRQSIHANDRVDRPTQTITITAPYGQADVRVQISFREVAEGVHQILEFDDFVEGSGPGVQVTIESAEFVSRYGNDVLPIVSGTIDVSYSTSSTFDSFGTFQLVTGETVFISSRVNLEVPQALR